MEGRVSSVQSLGAVDGPGLRYVIFLQGCPLRCKYCHNPETWDPAGGEPRTAENLCRTVLRYRPYFGETGGVTVSGGEPLMQPEFTAELFRLLHEHGVHTALDTAGAGDLEKAEAVLKHTDLVLCDVKFAEEADYRAHCGGSLAHTLDFLRLTARLDIPVWVRHVVAPGLTDTPASLRRVFEHRENRVAAVQEHLRGEVRSARHPVPDGRQARLHAEAHRYAPASAVKAPNLPQINQAPSPVFRRARGFLHG